MKPDKSTRISVWGNARGDIHSSVSSGVWNNICVDVGIDSDVGSSIYVNVLVPVWNNVRTIISDNIISDSLSQRKEW